jgi:hypothetical protein
LGCVTQEKCAQGLGNLEKRVSMAAGHHSTDNRKRNVNVTRATLFFCCGWGGVGGGAGLLLMVLRKVPSRAVLAGEARETHSRQQQKSAEMEPHFTASETTQAMRRQQKEKGRGGGVLEENRKDGEDTGGPNCDAGSSTLYRLCATDLCRQPEAKAKTRTNKQGKDSQFENHTIIYMADKQRSPQKRWHL